MEPGRSARWRSPRSARFSIPTESGAADNSWLAAIHDISLIMAVVPAAAIVVALALLRPKRAER